jgi:hypothetical protein
MSVSAIGGTLAAQNGFTTPKTNTVVVTTQPAGPTLSTVKDPSGTVITTTSIGPSARVGGTGAASAALHVTA